MSPRAAARVEGSRIPLSALRPVLDEGSLAAGWPVDCNGIAGRVLLLPSEARLTFPVANAGAARLSAEVMLLPREWRDSVRSIRASVSVELAGGTQHDLWSATLRTMAEGGSADPLPVECRLPAEARSVTLASGMTSPGEGHLSGTVWRRAELVDQHTVPAANMHPPRAAAGGVRPLPAAPSTGRSLISVLTPVHDPPLAMLEEAIASVRAQSYPHWELCLADDGSRDPGVIAALDRHAAEDRRIRLVRAAGGGGISAATNLALELATGDYIALLDHDDTLSPDALDHVAELIGSQPELDMVYSDEEIMSEFGRRVAVHLKPGWAPDTARTMMYASHLGVYRRSLALEIGGFRPEFDGTQDYDFVLRLAERTDRVAHIPRVLYRWRAHTGSAAGGDQAKAYAYVLQPQAIAAHLKRCGVRGRVDFAGTIQGLHRILYDCDPASRVALVVSLRREDRPGEAGHQLARTLLDQPLANCRLVLVGQSDVASRARDTSCAAGIEAERVCVVEANAEAGATAALDAASSATAGDDLLLLTQSPIVGLTHDWLRRLAGYASQPKIAAAGPIVMARNGRIEQAGIAWSRGVPLHLLHGADGAAGTPGVFNLMALSGVLMTRRETFESLGGLRAEMGDLGLIDYCLRAGERGLRNVIVPDVRVRNVGADRAENDLEAMARLRDAWDDVHTDDPYYNPNYAQDRGDYLPAARD